MTAIVKCYLRVGRGRNGYKYAVSPKPNPSALSEVMDGAEREIPTVQTRLALRFEDDAFSQAEIEIPIETARLGVAAGQESMSI